MDREQRGEQRKRLNEIVEVLRRNEIVRGMTPDKLCAVMEELGPTFIKLGQILSMRSDFLPQEYCDALTRLRTQVEPMPFEQVEAILRKTMENVVKLSVPLLIDMHAGKNWAEAK